MIFVPLLGNGKPIGLISLLCNDEFDEDYIDMLGSIANNISFAIEKLDLYSEIKQYYLKTIKTLVAAIEAKDPYTQGHSVRVAQYSVTIAKELGMTAAEIEEIEIAGILHDIGKIGISDTILTKPGILEPHEYEVIMNHPGIGCHILRPIGLSENIINATLLHHKRYDLTGYPKDENPTELPLYANIICIADAYDAMTSNRSYKLPMTKEEALEELVLNSGTQFSPKLVEIMINLYNKNMI
jgi:putative nucleotidyltransferase with HDIG domain